MIEDWEIDGRIIRMITKFISKQTTPSTSCSLCKGAIEGVVGVLEVKKELSDLVRVELIAGLHLVQDDKPVFDFRLPLKIWRQGEHSI